MENQKGGIIGEKVMGKTNFWETRESHLESPSPVGCLANTQLPQAMKMRIVGCSMQGCENYMRERL